MKRFDIKSVILGIGIGIILTSIINLIYISGAKPTDIISDEEIIRRAEELGMIEKPAVFDDSTIK